MYLCPALRALGEDLGDGFFCGRASGLSGWNAAATAQLPPSSTGVGPSSPTVTSIVPRSLRMSSKHGIDASAASAASAAAAAATPIVHDPKSNSRDLSSSISTSRWAAASAAAAAAATAAARSALVLLGEHNSGATDARRLRRRLEPPGRLNLDARLCPISPTPVPAPRRRWWWWSLLPPPPRPLPPPTDSFLLLLSAAAAAASDGGCGFTSLPPPFVRTFSRSGSLKNTEDCLFFRTLCRFFTPSMEQISVSRASWFSSGFFEGGGVKTGSVVGVTAAVLVVKGELFDSHRHGFVSCCCCSPLPVPSKDSKLRFKNANIPVIQPRVGYGLGSQRGA